MRAVTGEAARTMMEPSEAMVRINDELTATTFSLSTQNTRQKIIKKIPTVKLKDKRDLSDVFFKDYHTFLSKYWLSGCIGAEGGTKDRVRHGQK